MSEVERWQLAMEPADGASEPLVVAAAYDAIKAERDEAVRALRAARPCVFNSRSGSWKEVLDLVDATLAAADKRSDHNQRREAMMELISHCTDGQPMFAEVDRSKKMVQWTLRINWNVL